MFKLAQSEDMHFLLLLISYFILKIGLLKPTLLFQYDLHEGEMRGWLNFKRERAARLAREEHQRLSAIRIQAWWRGVLVRRALGQFKYLRQTKKQPGKGKKK